MRQTRGRGPVRAAGVAGVLLLAGVGSMPVAAQTSGSSIVEEALKDARQDQERDSGRVRRMVDEAVQGAVDAPSGEETVNPPAPVALLPLSGSEPGVLPPGFKAEDLKERPVRDGTGEQIGTLRGLVRDEASGLTQVMVEFTPLFGKPAKVSVLPVDTLIPAEAAGDGYVVELTPVAYDAMPAYRWAGEAWHREGA